MRTTFLSGEASPSVPLPERAGGVSGLWQGFFLFLRRNAKAIRYMRRGVCCERALDRLPFDIRKDIGWPEIYLAELNRERDG